MKGQTIQKRKRTNGQTTIYTILYTQKTKD